MTSGVPQGSVLGLLLFALVVSDISSTVNNFCSLFADGTKIHAALYDAHNSCTTNLQEDLDRLQNWRVDIQMRFHPAKRRTMHLGKHNPNIKYTLPIDDGTLHKIAQTAEEKDLAVTIDDKLVFSPPTHSIQVNKANRAVGLIRHTFKHLDKESFLYLYKSLVHPHLEYALVIWSPKIKKHQDSTEKVQIRATRLLPEISHLSYTDRLLTPGLPSLKYRRERTDVIQLFKITHGFDTVVVVHVQYAIILCSNLP